jgi:methionine sulfoxide reductase heme-binding subunit
VTTAPAVWYLIRASGGVALLLLTLSLSLGIATSNRWRLRGSALYVTTTVHRNASLLAVVFLGVHILTSLIDADASVSLASSLLPIGPGIWLALGALSFDLVAAIVVTSLIRKHLPFRLWRAIHWAAYASWPFAIWHGIGMGSDAGTWWLRAVTILCVAWFAGVVVWRVSRQEELASA